MVGVGAFGEFSLPHLSRFFDVCICDPGRDLGEISERLGVRQADLKAVAGRDIVLLAIPLSQFRPVAREIAPHLRPGSLVVDVCSVKTSPLSILRAELPPTVEVVGTHPLFGPQSGRDGIGGLRIAVCPANGRRNLVMERFLRKHLKLDVVSTTAELHDRQMAYVQGLTHLIGRIAAAMDVPQTRLATASFLHLQHMTEMVRYDSQELFRTIVAGNPFARDVMEAFSKAAADVLGPIGPPWGGASAQETGLG